MQVSVAVANARLDAIEALIGIGPVLRLYTGVMPANCAVPDTIGPVTSMSTAVNWLGTASGGVKMKTGSWAAHASSNAGIITYFRLVQVSTCHMQGTCSLPGGGGDMILSNTNLADDQLIVVLDFVLTDNSI